MLDSIVPKADCFVQSSSFYSHKCTWCNILTSAFSPLTGSSPGGCRMEIHSRPSGYTIVILKSDPRTRRNIMHTVWMIEFTVEAKCRWVERIVFWKRHGGLLRIRDQWCRLVYAAISHLKVAAFINSLWRSNNGDVPSVLFSVPWTSEIKDGYHSKMLSFLRSTTKPGTGCRVSSRDR